MTAEARILDPGHATDLCWWSAAQLSAMARAAQARLQPWCERWGPSLRVQAHLAWDAGDVHDWRTEAADGRPGLRVGTSATATASATAALHAMLFDAPPLAAQHATVAMGLAQQALDDWADTLESLDPAHPPGDSPTGAPPSRRPTRPWSGAVALRFEVSARGTHWCCAVELAAAPAAALLAPATSGDSPGSGSGQVRSTRSETLHTSASRPPHRSPSGPLHSPAQAVGGLALPLEVLAGEVELDLGTLRSLRIGDVLMLPLPLDKPLSVRLARAEGAATAADPAHPQGAIQGHAQPNDAHPTVTHLCDAHLGARHGRRAVELCAAAAELPPAARAVASR